MAQKPPGVWGIDLGQCALKAVRLELIDGKVTATAFDYIEHPKILSQPDADPDQLTREALQQFLSRNELKGDTVVIGVPGQSGLARFVKLPPVEEKKIDDIVRFEAKQQIPFPLEEVVWDYQKIGAGEVTDGFALETEIGLFAMKRDMVNRALQQFKEVGVEIHVVQMAPLALCNFVSFDLLDKRAGTEADAGGARECVVAMDIGADNSNLVITDGAKIIWQRPIPLGGNHFTRALTKDLKLTFAKAEHVKRNAMKSPDLRKILSALRPVLNDFVNEVQRSLGYFTNTHRDATIAYMIGLGNAFRLPGLQKFLQEKLQLEVHKLQQLNHLEGDEVVAAPQFKENVLSFAVAYGLAVQGLGLTRLQTNLLPAEIRRERLIRAKKPWAAAAAAALLLAVGSYTFGRSVQWSMYNNKEVETYLGQAKAVQGEASQIVSKYNELEQQAKQSAEAVNRIASGVKERFNWNQIYKYIDDALPRPDGSKLSRQTELVVYARSIYFDQSKEAQAAFRWWQSAQNPDLTADGGGKRDLQSRQKELQQAEEFKKHLVQVNVEGVDCLYSDDLTPFFTNLVTEKNVLRGLPQREKDHIWTSKENLPKSGWVFAVRGYTYHNKGVEFVTNTLVENLRRPTAPGVENQLPEEVYNWVYGTKANDYKDQKIRYVFVYDYKEIENPQPGEIYTVKTSPLPKLLTAAAAGTGGEGGYPGPGSAAMPGPGADDMGGGFDPTGGGAAAPSRSAWVPIGEVASTALHGAGTAGQDGYGGAPGSSSEPAGDYPGSYPNDPTGAQKLQPIERAMRTEFVVLFVWIEPSTLEGAADGATGATEGVFQE